MAAGVEERPARSSRAAMTWTELPRGRSARRVRPPLPSRRTPSFQDGWRLKENLTCGAHTSVSGGREAAGGVLVHMEDVYTYTV